MRLEVVITQCLSDVVDFCGHFDSRSGRFAGEMTVSLRGSVISKMKRLSRSVLRPFESEALISSAKHLFQIRDGYFAGEITVSIPDTVISIDFATDGETK